MSDSRAAVMTGNAVSLFVYLTGTHGDSYPYLCFPHLPLLHSRMTSLISTGGFYNRHFPKFLQWINYLSFIRYGYGGVAKIEFSYGEPIRFVCFAISWATQKVGNDLFAELFINIAIIILSRCKPVGKTQFLTCIETNGTGTVTGNEILEAANLTDPLWMDMLMLFVMLLVCRISGYIGLRLLQKPKTAKRH